MTLQVGASRVVGTHAPPMLDSKFEPPPIPKNAAVRRRLMSALGESKANFVLLVAGPGYGKTVTMRQWAEVVEPQSAWISLDRQDDEQRFWRYLIEGVSRVSGGSGSEAGQMLDDEPTSDAFLDVLLADLADLPAPLLILLDDLHVVRSKRTLEQFAFFVERLPPDVRVAATSRVDPDLPLGRWRVEGLLDELRQEDLRFRPDEAEALVRAVADVHLDDDDLHVLVDRTEGWVATLQLALLSLVGRHDPHTFIESTIANDRMMTDYLIGEVLDRLPADDRHLVLRLSVVDDFDLDLASSVTGYPDAGERLRSLEANGVLLMPTDESRRRFRFHQLVRDLLEQELRWRHPADAPELHRRAAAHLEASGLPQQAVPHRLAAGDVEAAFDLATEPVYRNIDRGDVHAARRWLERFPEGFVSDDFDRTLTYCVLLVAAGRPEDAEIWSKRLDAAEAAGELKGSLLVRHRAQRFVMRLLTGDLVGAELAALRLLDVAGDAHFVGPLLGRMPGMFARLAISREDLTAADRWLKAAAAGNAKTIAVDDLVPLSIRAQIALAHGRVGEAEEVAQEALRFATDHDLHHVVPLGESWAALGQAQLEAGWLRDADESLRNAIEVFALLGTTSFEVRARISAMEIAVGRFGPPTGFAVLAATNEALRGRALGPDAQAWLTCAEANLHLDDADVARARELIRTLSSGWQQSLLLARSLLIDGEFDEIPAMLDDCANWNPRAQVDALLLLARASSAAECTHHVQSAAEIAVPLCLVHRFRREGLEMHRIVRRSYRERPTPELETVLGWFDANRHAEDLGDLVAPATVHRLTERERALLVLLPTHLTYREIAGQLCVSINTVKTYQKAVFQKLEVPSRSEAVAVGRQAGLIS